MVSAIQRTHHPSLAPSRSYVLACRSESSRAPACSGCPTAAAAAALASRTTSCPSMSTSPEPRCDRRPRRSHVPPTRPRPVRLVPAAAAERPEPWTMMWAARASRTWRIASTRVCGVKRQSGWKWRRRGEQRSLKPHAAYVGDRAELKVEENPAAHKQRAHH